MSYETIVAGLTTCFETIEGLTVLDYEPTSIEPPTLYTLFDSFQKERQGQIKSTRWRSLHRVCVHWQDNEQAEQQIRPYLASVPAAIDADPHLGEALHLGLASITEGIGGWVSIGGVIYRCIDFYSSVLEKE